VQGRGGGGWVKGRREEKGGRERRNEGKKGGWGRKKGGEEREREGDTRHTNPSLPPAPLPKRVASRLFWVLKQPELKRKK